MRRIRSQDTKPELLLRSALHRLGLRYRVHARNLPGKPDIVFPRVKVAVFVHGCFWHQHPGCIEASRPRTNVSYWLPKLARNIERDTEHVGALRRAGFRVLTLWECEIEHDIAIATRAVVTVLATSKSESDR
jgi:DNA mismatch endonuclease, patch repair protein